jgi:hypothetical protein
MAFILSAASAIWSVVASVTAIVATAVTTIVMAIASALSLMGTILWSGSVGVVTGILNAVGLISGATASNILTSLNAINVIGAQAYLTVGSAISAITSGFKAFLEAIHFHTLIQINDIAYLVSSDYREMMNKVYAELADFSNAVGLGAQFITLAIRNARNIVLDVSTMVGRNYDLAEVNWLNEMNGFFTTISDNARRIANDPYLLLSYIDEQLIKPSADLKGSVMQGLFNTVDTILDFTDKTVDDIATLKSDLQTFVNDLPASIKEDIKPLIDAAIEPFDSFMDKVYTPNFTKVSQVLDILSVRLDDRTDDINNLVDRLRKPGDLLQSVDLLPSSERTEQRTKMFTTVNTPIINIATKSDEILQDEINSLDSISEALKVSLPETPYNVPEEESLTKGTQGKPGSEDSWYVGDY